MLAELVSALPEERRRGVELRFSDALAQVEIGLGPDRPPLGSAEAYFALKVPCPFLEDEACSIHADRPTTCREYLVTSAPQACATLNAGLDFLRLPLSLSQCLAQVAGRALGTAPAWVALTYALAWAREHGAEGNREFDSRQLISWLGEALAGQGHPAGLG